MDPLQSDIDRATRRAQRYWLDDGLQEALVGCFFVLVGLFLVFQGMLPRASPVQAALALAFPLLLIGLGALARRLVLTLKDRYVHPRTGYVAFQKNRQRAGWAGGLVAGAIAFMIVVLSRKPSVLAWLPALQGLLFAGAFLYAGRKVPRLRFPIEALLTAIAGFGLAFVRLDQDVASGLLLLWTGAAMSVGGLVAFRAYLQQAHPGEDA